MKYITETDRLLRNAEFSKKFAIKYDVPLSFPFEYNNYDDPRKLLVVNAIHPGITLTAGYRMAGLHPENGGRAKEKLVADGMIHEHSLVKKGSGGHPIVLELLLPGIEAVKKMGIVPVSLEGKGSFKHRVYVHCYLVPWAKAQNYKHWIERWFEPKAIDFVYEDEYGRLNAVEVFLSGSVEWIVDSAKKCASLDGIYSVILAFESQKMMAGTKKMLKNELMHIQEKISIKFLGEYWNDDEK